LWQPESALAPSHLFNFFLEKEWMTKRKREGIGLGMLGLPGPCTMCFFLKRPMHARPFKTMRLGVFFTT